MNNQRPYRGKEKKSGEWVYGWYCKVDDYHLIIPDTSRLVNPCGGLVIDAYPNYYIDRWVEVIPETVKIEVNGQWFNEKELSDIVKKGLISDSK